MQKQLFLFGDSHLVAVKAGFDQLGGGIAVAGGPISLSPTWAENFHSGLTHTADGQPLLTLTQDRSRDILKQFTGMRGQETDNFLEIRLPLVLSVNMLTLAPLYWEWLEYSHINPNARHRISRQLFDTITNSLCDQDVPHVALIPPGMRSNATHQGELFLALRDNFIATLRSYGTPVLDITEQTCDANGILAERYWVEDQRDQTHANTLWGKEMARACMATLFTVATD